MLKRSRYIIFFLLASINAIAQDTSAYKEKYRPLYHFSPAKGWIGDPDGLVYKNGLFHLYWWGHAVSPDLIHWEEQPRPMKGDHQAFSFFSGSVAVDNNNTAGFGKESYIAVFTRHFRGDSLPETQILSVSHDNGKSYRFYENNPVLDINKVYFRDPQVSWHAPTSMWKMVVTVPDIQQIQILQSKDLKQWEYCSSFEGLGAKNSFWECPDLFEVPIAGTSEKKWVLIIGRGPNRVQYFVGDFDGKTYTTDKNIADYLKFGKGLGGIVFDDFELGTQKWLSKTATFFGLNTRDVTDFLGNGFVGTSADQPTTGAMKSQVFTISQNAINFLIAGGMHPDSTCINLIVNGKIARTATGDNTKVFKWRGWDVRELKGQQAYLEIADRDTTKKLGYIAIDHITFDDKLFDQNLEHALWLDFGPDYYATRTWRNYDSKRSFADSTFSIGWMGNWDYANKVPSTWGKGFQSLPRSLSLKQTEFGYRLIQQPIPALISLRNKLYSGKAIKLKKNAPFNKVTPKKNAYEIDLEVRPGKGVFGLNLLSGEGRKLVLSYDPGISVLTLDRINCTDHLKDTSFTRLFAKKIHSPVNLKDGKLQLQIFIDQSSVEVFTNNGESVISAVTFPSPAQTGVSLFTDNDDTVISRLDVWTIDSIWKNKFSDK